MHGRVRPPWLAGAPAAGSSVVTRPVNDANRVLADRVLADLPAALWDPLLQAVRRAAGHLGRAALPTGLRPYAEWQPVRLRAERPRRAVAAALADDPGLREAVGRRAALGRLGRRRGRRPAAAGTGPRCGARDRGARRARALRRGRGGGRRDGGARDAARGRSARETAAGVGAGGAGPAGAVGTGEASAGRSTHADRITQGVDGGSGSRSDDDADRRRQELVALRRHHDAVRRRADGAEERAVRAEAQLREAHEEMATLRRQLERLRGRLDDEQRRSRDRLARLRRRADEAQARARIDADRVGGVAERLAALSDELRLALSEPPAASSQAVAEAAPAAPSLLRRARPAQPGRPCVLPAGLGGEEPAAVEALLRVPGLEVVLDGYNVSKDLRGVPGAGLADQRAWLERIASGVAARYGPRVTIVFDGDRDRVVAAGAGRGVRVVFTPDDEIADERIIGIVTDAEPGAPLLVVTSDREVRDACLVLGANVVASGVFLRAVV